MEVVPIIVGAWIAVLCVVVALEESARRPAMRYKAPAPSMSPPPARDSISAAMLAGTIAGLSPVMTRAF